jgi:hypothetical protein
MAVTIKQTESLPDAYPASPESPASLSAAAEALADVAWQRIEAYITHRWTERAVEWIVEGPGEWTPPLKPAAIAITQVWSSRANEWESVTLSASPLGGYYLSVTGPYRFGGIVGGGSPAPEVPAAVLEAHRRLCEYMAARPGNKPGASSESVTAGSVAVSHSRSPSWLAKAIENSGAGDLLRNYRRA